MELSRAISECSNLLLLAAEALKRLASPGRSGDDAALMMYIDEMADIASRLRELGATIARRAGH